MSELKTNKISPATGTALAVGDSGDTITVPSGATLDISASTLTPPATMPASSGINFTALNATNLGSGTVPTARLGSGTASSSTFLRGDQTYAAAGGGKVLQVVFFQEDGVGTTTTTTSSWTDTGTTAQITCAATTSKVLIMFGGAGYSYRYNDGNQYFPLYQLYETATTTAFPGGSQNRWVRGTTFQPAATGSNRIAGACVGSALHSPSSTALLTYTVQIKNEYTSVAWVETEFESAYITLMEIGA